MSCHQPPSSEPTSDEDCKRCENCYGIINIGKFNPKESLSSITKPVSKPKPAHRNVELADILANEATEEKESTDYTHLESSERREVHSSTPTRHQTYSYNINLPGEGFYNDNRGEYYEDQLRVTSAS